MFPETIPDNKHLKWGKSDGFGRFVKVLVKLKMREISNFGA